MSVHHHAHTQFTHARTHTHAHLAREVEDHILLLALDVAGGFLKFSEVPKSHCPGILLHIAIYI